MSVINFKCPHCESLIEYDKKYDGLKVLNCPVCQKEIDLTVTLSFVMQLKELFVTFGSDILNTPHHFYSLLNDVIIGQEDIIRVIFVLSRIDFFFPKVYEISTHQNKEEEAKTLAKRVYRLYFLEETMVFKIILFVFDALNIYHTSDNQISINFKNLYSEEKGEEITINVRKLSLYQAYIFYLKKEYAHALRWFNVALLEGESDANFYLGIMYRNAKGVEKDLEKSFKYFLAGAKKENAICLYFAGSCYLNGQGTEKDLEQGFKFIEKSATKGYLEAMYLCGYCYDLGIGVTQNDEKAVKWYVLAADNGHLGAMTRLAMILMSSKRNVKRDLDRGLSYLLTAANKNYMDAQYFLAYCYFKGIGVEKSDEEYLKWLNLAAANGHKKAIERLKEIKD